MRHLRLYFTLILRQAVRFEALAKMARDGSILGRKTLLLSNVGTRNTPVGSSKPLP